MIYESNILSIQYMISSTSLRRREKRWREKFTHFHVLAQAALHVSENIVFFAICYKYTHVISRRVGVP